MKMTKLSILTIVAVCTLGVSNTIAQQQMRGSRDGPAMRSRPMAAPNTASHHFRPGDHDFDDRFRFHDFDDRFRFRNAFFFNAGFPFGFPFGFPAAYPYPYYGYYPPPYYGYDPGYQGSANYGYGQGYQGSANGSVVVEVQRRLAREGFYHGAIDGVIGSGTRSAIRGFQRAHGLPVDGRISASFLSTMGLS